jgi:hypothetical protein
MDAKADLRRYLQLAREAVLWKLEGLAEYDVRRPMTPTGTNLLGLVKHLAYIELGYFGATFGRPYDGPQPWLEEDVDPTADLWATAEESPETIVALYRRAWQHADATLHRVLVHVIAETNRHAGHADIVRELIDGSAGLRPDAVNLPDVDAGWWAGYRERLEQVAREAGGR